MIIHNSMKLLEQLSEIEERIQKIEKAMDVLGIELDREKLLKILASERALGPLTGTKN